MTPKELASECQSFIAKATARITGIGADQYHVEGQPQRFETMPLDGLFEYAEEELLDLANYAAMLNIRMRRLREEATRDRTFERMRIFFATHMPLLSMGGQRSKLEEEVAEFLKEPSAEEAADIAIVLGAYAHTQGWDLDSAIAAKMEKNERRTWEYLGDGYYKHVKGATERPAGDWLEPGLYRRTRDSSGLVERVERSAPLGTDPDKAATA